jgi:hypothetical protein
VNGDWICLYRAPYFPNSPGDSLEIPADTLRFVYDSAGNMVQADNRSAQIRRSYYLNGALATDTLRVRNYSDNSFGHTYSPRYAYDRDKAGPMDCRPAKTVDRVQSAGGLTQITDGGGAEAVAGMSENDN